MSSHRYTLDESILNAALKLLNTESEDDFTIEQLARVLNVSRATVYRHIGSKGALLQRLVKERGLMLGEQDRLDTRTRILQATRAVLGRFGFVGLTMEQVAEAANVGVATVYRHFGDKESLIRAFSEEYTPRRQLAESTINPGEDVKRDLTQLAASILRFLDDNRDLIQLSLAQNSEMQYMSQLRGAPERTLSRIAAYFEAQITAGRLPAHHSSHRLAMAFMGMLLGFGFMGPTYYDIPLEDPEQTARFITQLFLQGVSP